MSQITDDLLPCPFCGGETHLTNSGPGRHFVHCMDCTSLFEHGTPEEALAAWNRRAVVLSPAARVVIETYGRDTPVDDLALVLFEAWCKADPTSGPATHPASFMATFADMARAVIALSTAPVGNGGEVRGRVKAGTTMGDDDDATLAAAMRKYNIGSAARADKLFDEFRALKAAAAITLSTPPVGAETGEDNSDA